MTKAERIKEFNDKYNDFGIRIIPFYGDLSGSVIHFYGADYELYEWFKLMTALLEAKEIMEMKDE